MHERGLCCRPLSVRPSVCPSVKLVYFIHTAEDIVKLLSQPGSPTDPRPGTQFQGELIRQGRQIHGVGKLCRFSTEIAVYLGNSTG